MADPYTDLGIASDPQDAKQEMEDDLAVRIPGWVSHPGSIEDALLEVVALQHARLGASMEDRAEEDFASFGQLVVQEALVSEEHATGVVTFTASDNAGVEIPAGTALSGSDGSGGEIVFVTTSDASIPALSTTVAAVPVEAVDPGLLASVVSGAGTMISAVDRVASVAFDAATSLGADGETQADYVERLARLLRLLTAGPVTAADYDLFLRTKIPTAYRVLVRDNYNPEHNLLSVNQASLETDTTGWAAVTNCTISQSATHAALGTKSLRLSSTAGGDMNATTPTGLSGEAVTPYQTCTARAQVKAGASARSCKAGIAWYDAAGTIIGTIAYGTPVTSSTANFDTLLTVTADAPALAAYAAVVVFVTATGGASELHYFDKIGLALGSSSTWYPGGTAPEGNERMLTASMIAADGTWVGATADAAATVLVDAAREDTFVFHIVAPEVTTIDVVYQIIVQAGYVAATVIAACNAALAAYLSPATWGETRTGDEPVWLFRPTLRPVGMLVPVIGAVDGVESVELVTARKGADAQATTPITLPGHAPLADLGTCVGTEAA